MRISDWSSDVCSSDLADQINQAFDADQPWVMAKGIATAGEEQKAALQNVSSRALAGFKALSVMLTLVLPVLTPKVAQYLFGAAQAYQWAAEGQDRKRVA